MCRLSLATCVYVLQACFVSSLFAERPTEKRDEATHVVTGTVENVYLHETECYQRYTVKIRVEEVERGEGLKPGEVFYAGCFRRRKDAPPEPSPQGHSVVPRTGQRIRAYVNERGGENEGVYPNWADVLYDPPLRERGNSVIRQDRRGRRGPWGLFRRGRRYAPPSASPPAETDSTDREAEAGVYPGSTHFSSGSAAGAPGPNGEGGGHVSWEAYHSDDEPAQVIDHYMASLGLEHHQNTEDGHTWHIPVDDRTDRMIGVWPATAKGPWSGGVPPPSNARTIILISIIAW